MNSPQPLLPPQPKKHIPVATSEPKKKLTLIIGVAIGLVVVLVAGFLTFMLLKPSTTQQNVNSKTFEMVTGAVTVDKVKPASIVLTPATQEWWNKLTNFTSNIEIAKVDFNSLKDGAVYNAFTVSKGKKFKNYSSFGLPTTFIVYSDVKKAEAASAKVDATIDHVQAGNMLLFLPAGAFSDVDYALTQYKDATKVTGSDLNLNGKAMWQISVKEFNSIYLQGRKQEDIQTYNQFLSKIGVTENTGWVGYSKDGLSWDGNVVNGNLGAAVSLKDLNAFLSQQVAYLKTDGTLAYGQNVPPENEQSGIIYPRQSILSNCCMIISNNSETIGELLPDNSKDKITGKPLTKTEGIYQVQAYSNKFLALMMGDTTAYPVWGFDKVTFTLQDISGKSNITLTPFKP